MNWFLWIILGGLAGWVANMIMKEDGGLIKNILLGIVGALLGGGIIEILGGSGVTGFNPYSFLVALIGAVAIIAIVRALKRK